MPRSVVFAPPPGWPPAPAGWLPPSGWEPPPDWPEAPAGWAFYLELPSPWVPHRVLVRSAHPSSRAHPAYLTRGARVRDWRPPRWLTAHAYILVPVILLALLVITVFAIGLMGSGRTSDQSAALRACSLETEAATRDAEEVSAEAAAAGRMSRSTPRMGEIRQIDRNGDGVLHIVGTFFRGAQAWEFACDARVSGETGSVLALDLAPLPASTGPG